MIGEKIKNLRSSRGLTMRELGEKAQITPGMVSRYENGKADPSKRILKRLSIAFQVPLSELTSE